MSRGGKRPGAGRPTGSNKYGEPTRMARIPISVAERLSQIAGNDQKPMVANSNLIQLAVALIEDGLQRLDTTTEVTEVDESQTQIQRGLDLIRYALGLDPEIASDQDPVATQSLNIGDRCRYVGQDPRLQEIAGGAVLVIQAWVNEQIVTVIAEGQFVRNFPIQDLRRVHAGEPTLSARLDRDLSDMPTTPQALLDALIWGIWRSRRHPLLFSPSQQDHALPCSGHHRFGTAGHVQLGEDRSDVKLDCVFRDPQSLGDRLIAQPLGHHGQHLDLTSGQGPGQRRCGR